MIKSYTDEKNTQVLIALLKAHGIRKVIASPGTTNVTLVGSMQSDSFFEMYSSVDERSAAYMACGLAAESYEPVIICCTGATASRNYFSGLTEAYYRKLPVLAITATQAISKVGHHIAQIIDRSSLPNDVVKLSVTLPIVKDDDDLWECELKANKAILELFRHGGGPVHINNPTTYIRSFNTKDLPAVRRIKRINLSDDFPKFPSGKVAIFLASHKTMSKEETQAIDLFCASKNAIVLCDHTSNYKGNYRILFSLVTCQEMLDYTSIRPDILIHIGEVSGDYFSISLAAAAKEVWRVNEDGEIRDTFRKLSYVFEMPEINFFTHYGADSTNNTDSYLRLCLSKTKELQKSIPDLPFSNIWIAGKMADSIPENSVIHFGILNSLRSWNFFEIPQSITSSSNVGGFGIDGGLSSLIGASLTSHDKLYFGIFGDLSFFYDMNSIGNRHLGNNLRILLINNGKGNEFKFNGNIGSQFGDDTDEYIAAARHFGNKSKTLVKNYIENLGFTYISASNKSEFNNVYEQFLNKNITDKSIFFEAFVESSNDVLALNKITGIETNFKGQTKKLVKSMLSDNSVNAIKKILKK
jgi:2-succinyl-5-enolpyruvyl-6-hydroxy-3-cyclohexene-1-carboxylate synthase